MPKITGAAASLIRLIAAMERLETLLTKREVPTLRRQLIRRLAWLDQEIALLRDEVYGADCED
jgi:hypothetical protein